MMKLETTFRFPKSTILLLFLFIFSIQSYANNNCGEINGFEFSNGSESMAIENGGVYNITDIPSNAFINLLIDGYSQSVRYAVRNDNTNEYDYITENVEPYTYPAGNRAWNLGTGTFTIRADLHRYNNGYGQRCDREMITFTVTETCNAFSGTATATMSNVSLVDGMATISATPNGDAVIPDGFTLGFVLTFGEELVIVDGDDISSFPVTEPGNYTIHPFVYNPNTLDVGIVEFGVTTGVDVLGLISQGGGDICASLDVAGAPISVETCSAEAGTLMANMDTACLVDGMATISATSNNDANIPDGYSSIYVLTQGEGLVIINAGVEPSFDVTEGGNYTIHTLVYNPDTLDLGIVEFGVTTGFDVFGLIIPGGGTICAALDVAGAPISVENPMAGTLTADMDMETLVDGAATISATPNGDINIPDGYSSIYVLTQGDDLVIVNAGAQPSFEVTEPGSYTIHTLVYNPNTLDLGIVELGVTTGVDVLGLISQGGGDICASLDVAGAPISVETCSAEAGTLMANMDTACLVDGMATISATSNNDANIPDGYSSIYVLTQGEGLVIINAGAEPSFDVTEGGNYTIHTLVYNPDTLDLGIVEFGVTTGFDVFGLIIPGGGNICAALDVAGAPISVENPMAETLTADMDMATLVDGAATISATPNGDINIPDGYSSIYVLTQGDDLVIVNAGAQPSFEVTEPGSYTIHTLVYNPNTLDLGIVELGVTTGVDVLGLISQGGGDICASLDVAGAPITVMEESCTAEAGTMYSSSPITCLMSGMASIEAMQNRPAEIPDGYEQLFVLTEAFTLTILNVSATPSFDVSDRGFYRIHSLVYNPETLDLSIVVPGETTGFDVVNLINNNDICASLDVHGAVNLVLGHNWFCSFFNNYYHKDAGIQSADVDNYIKEYKSYKTFEADFVANNSEISLYPNPVKSTLNVSIQTFDDEVMTYKMRDMSGRQVATGLNNSLNNGSGQIDATNLANGMYIISFESEYRTIIKKVMVNK